MKYQYHADGSPNQEGAIFVFGSNLAGIHGAGAARYAFDHAGAVWGIGVGPQGDSFAIPTKDYNIVTMGIDEIIPYIADFIAYAMEYPDTKFIVTRIGCGLAGYRDEQIAPLFADAPTNCSFSEQWKVYVEPEHA